MRYLLVSLILIFLGVGIVLGVLNPQPLQLDLLLFSNTLPAGVVIMLAVLGGVLLGGIALYLGVIHGLRRQLTRLRRELRSAERAPASDSTEPARPNV